MTDDPKPAVDVIRWENPCGTEAVQIDATATWAAVREALQAGAAADDVADALLSLDDDDLDLIHDERPEAVDAGSTVHALMRAMAQGDHLDRWSVPISPGSVSDLIDERDRLQAENAKLRALLGDARKWIALWEDRTDDETGVALLARIDGALAEGTR